MAIETMALIRRARRPATALSLVIAVQPGATAIAADPQPLVDPRSPASKEYAIPLDDGRSLGAGGAAHGESANTGAGRQLFGAGLERRPTTGSARVGASPSAGPQRVQRSRSAHVPAPPTAGATARKGRLNVGKLKPGADEDGRWLYPLLTALSVVALGGAAVFAERRVVRPRRT